MKLKSLFAIASAALAFSAFSSSATVQAQTGGKLTEISGKVLSVGDDDFVLNTGKEKILVDADDDALRQAKLSVGE